MQEVKTVSVQCPNCKHTVEVREGDRVKVCIGDGAEHRTEKELQDVLDGRRTI